MPYDQRDADTNRFVPTYADSAFLEAVADAEIAGTGEVADAVGCTRANAYERLNQLVERGELEKRKIGGRNVYSLSE